MQKRSAMTVCREQPPGTDDGRLGKENDMGNRLREIRKAQRYSMAALEKASGVSRTSIYKIENGKTNPTTKTIEKLAKALKCKPRDLLS